MDEIELFLYIETVDWDLVKAALDLKEKDKEDAAKAILIMAIELNEATDEPEAVEIEIEYCSKECKNTNCCRK